MKRFEDWILNIKSKYLFAVAVTLWAIALFIGVCLASWALLELTTS